MNINGYKQLPMHKMHPKDLLGDNWCDYVKAAQQATTSEQLIEVCRKISDEQDLDPYGCCVALMLALGSRKEFDEYCRNVWTGAVAFLCEFLVGTEGDED